MLEKWKLYLTLFPSLAAADLAGKPKKLSEGVWRTKRSSEEAKLAKMMMSMVWVSADLEK